MSYAMTWQLGEGARQAGRIDVTPASVELVPTAPTGPPTHIDFDDVRAVVLRRRVLHLRSARLPELRISSIDRPGSLRELAERLAVNSFSDPVQEEEA